MSHNLNSAVAVIGIDIGKTATADDRNRKEFSAIHRLRWHFPKTSRACRFRGLWFDGDNRARAGSRTKDPRGETAMRFMVMVKATKDSEAGKMPSEELLLAMAKFNEEMVKAGVMLDANGLQPSSKGARVRFSGDKRTVIDGPFAETKELVAGYWVLQVKSKEEAIEWIKRCPNPHEGESEIEIRQVFELEDFGASEAVEHHRRLGEQIGKK
jgi:hypothetical protein